MSTNSSSNSVSLSDSKDLEPPSLETIPQTSAGTFRLSLRLKTTLAAIALGILPIVVIGSLAYAIAGRQIKDDAAQSQEALAIAQADQVSAFMFERFGDINVLANQAILVNPRLRSQTTTAEKQKVLDKVVEAYAVYDSVVVFDLKGNVVVQSSSKQPFRGNGGNRKFFQETIKTGLPVISQPEQSQITGELAIEMAAPVFDANTKKMIYVVRSSLPVKNIDKLLRANHINRGNETAIKAEYHLVDAGGKIFIAKEEEEAVGEDATLSVPVFAQMRTAKSVDTREGSEVDNPHQQLVTYVPVQTPWYTPGLNWSVMSHQDTDVVFAARNRLLLLLQIGTVVSALAISLLATFLANRATRPILQATQVVEKLGKGDLQTRITVQGSDELATLGTNINSMADQIEQLLRNLRESNAAELAQQNQKIIEESEILQADVGHLLDIVSVVEDGDLTVQASVNDRATGLVADTLNRLIEQLGTTLAQVLGAANAVSQGSANLEQLTKTVANNAQEQAQEVTQVLQLTEQVEQSAQSSAFTVNKANQSLLDVRSIVEQGQGAIHTMTEGIGVLQQGTNRIVQQMKTLGEFVGLADQFVQEQSQIASLTQVLALNATLVAARASEQRDPRQFSVVAREFEAIAAQVGNLAQQTNDGLVSLQQRTDQIHTVVSDIDAEVQSLGGLVSGFTTGVEQSNQVFANVRTTTGQVVEAGEEVANSNQEIVDASQSTAKAMHDIAQLAERTAQLTQNTQLQTEQMEALSRELLSSIQFFRLPASVNSDR